MAAKEVDSDLSDLDDLLDDALGDFGKTKGARKPKETLNEDLDSEVLLRSRPARTGLKTPPNSFVDPSPLHKIMDDPLKELQKLEECAKEMNSPEEASKELEDTFANLLAQLNMNPPNIENGPFQEADFLPMMQQVMKSLLSKKMLYPALKRMIDKYPEWLAENRSKLSEKELETNNKQQSIARQICQVFEKPVPESDTQGQEDQFKEVMKLMESMQMLGEPPKELLGDRAMEMPNFDDCKMS